MKREDLIAYARRDWGALAEVKRTFQRTESARRGGAENLAIVDQLRAQVHAQRPDWPTEADREADLAAHIALAARLRRAAGR